MYLWWKLIIFCTASFTLILCFTVFTDKISLVIIGNGEFLKKSLITNIVGKDLSALSKRKFLENTEIYENESLLFICTPDLKTPGEEITKLFNEFPNSDMCLLVVEDGFSSEEVRQQLEDLRKKTDKPSQKFRVVLPLQYNYVDFRQLKYSSLEQIVSELDKLDKNKQQIVAR